MTQDNTDDGEDEPTITRRDAIIGALGAAGTLAIGGGSSQSTDTQTTGVTAGGGLMSTENPGQTVQWLEGSFADRPSAGVARRYYYVDDESDAEYGRVYKDTGSSWTEVTLGGLLEEDGSGNVTPRDGQPISASAVSTDSIDISTFAAEGADFVCWAKENRGPIHVFSQSGELVAGGPNNLNVSDATDFGEIFETILNDLATSQPMRGPAITLASAPNGEDPSFLFKSTANITSTFTLRGPGRYRAQVGIDSSMVGNDCIVMDQTQTDPVWDLINWVDGIRFRDPNNAGGPRSWLKARSTGTFDGYREFGFSNCEFKDAEYGLDLESFGGWNYVTNCWFVNGGARFVDGADLVFIGNHIRGATSDDEFIFEQLPSLMATGNHWTGDPTFSIDDNTLKNLQESTDVPIETANDYNLFYDIYSGETVNTTWSARNYRGPDQFEILLNATMGGDANGIYLQFEDEKNGLVKSGYEYVVRDGTTLKDQSNSSLPTDKIPLVQAGGLRWSGGRWYVSHLNTNRPVMWGDGAARGAFPTLQEATCEGVTNNVSGYKIFSHSDDSGEDGSINSAEIRVLRRPGEL